MRKMTVMVSEEGTATYISAMSRMNTTTGEEGATEDVEAEDEVNNTITINAPTPHPDTKRATGMIIIATMRTKVTGTSRKARSIASPMSATTVSIVITTDRLW